jgi:hypothetical protein
MQQPVAEDRPNLISRRTLWTGAAATLIAAPAIVRVASLMPVRGLVLPVERPPSPGFNERLAYSWMDSMLRSGWTAEKAAHLYGGMGEAARGVELGVPGTIRH